MLAAAMGDELKLSEGEIENLASPRCSTKWERPISGCSALVALRDRRVARGGARALRGGRGDHRGVSHYYEIVGDDWDIEALPMASL